MPDPASSPVPLQRSSFSSRDAAEVTDYIRQMYTGNRSSFTSPRDAGATFEVQFCAAPGVTGSRITSSLDYVTECDAFNAYVFFLVRRGRVRTRYGATEVRSGLGEVAAHPMGVPFDVGCAGSDVLAVQLPVERLDDLANEIADVPVGALRFRGGNAVSAGMRNYQRSVITLVCGALLTPDSPMSSPLVAEEMTRTAAVAALHAFPNNTMTADHLPGPGRVGPATLRRAVAYIEANADRPLTLSAIAAAAGTGPRAVQNAFRAYYETTPLGYVRRVRLQRAHRELQAGDPTQGATVAAIATRWGFAKADRFAAAYRAEFGVLPRHTLWGLNRDG